MRRCVLAAAIAVLLPAGAVGADLYVSQYPLAYTTISVDGRSVRAMIDTGMQVPLSISPEYAARIRFKGKATGAKIRGYTGDPVDVLAGKVHNVQIGGVLIGSVAAAVLGDSVPGVSKQVGTQFDAVIGWPLLSRFVTVLDYPRHRFRLAMNVPVITRNALVLTLAADRGLPVAEGMLDGKPVRFLIDTGAPGCAFDSQAFGARDNDVRRVELSLVENKWNVECRAKDMSVLSHDRITATLGEDLLSRYLVIFDGPGKRLIFEPRT